MAPHIPVGWNLQSARPQLWQGAEHLHLSDRRDSHYDGQAGQSWGCTSRQDTRLPQLPPQGAVLSKKASAQNSPKNAKRASVTGGGRTTSFASLRRFCAVAARVNSNWAPHGPRKRRRPSRKIRLRCANRISTRLRSRRERSNTSVLESVSKVMKREQSDARAA
jgi:hypothetical protein